MKRPDIPKRLAARIRGAQEKVRQARLAIVMGEHNMVQSRRRLDEFDSDPEAFAARYYRGHGVDSYPVQTTISRERERLSYYERRIPQRIAELVELELGVERVEEEVLAEVAAMRPTKGRVPWPRRLPTFKHFRAQFEAEEERQRLQWEEQRARDREEFERLEAEEEAKAAARYEREMQEAEAQIAKAYAAMTPEQRAEAREKNARIVEALKAGEITMQDILSALKR